MYAGAFLKQYHFHHRPIVPKPEGNFRDYVGEDCSEEENLNFRMFSISIPRTAHWTLDEEAEKQKGAFNIELLLILPLLPLSLASFDISFTLRKCVAMLNLGIAYFKKVCSHVLL
jgi:hypothetical protein